MPVALRAHKPETKYNVTTEFPYFGLHEAASTGNIGLVKYALDKGQPVNSVLDGVLPLHAASSGGNDLVVKLLIEHGADVNAPRLPRRYSSDKNRHRDVSAPIVGSTGATPLHFAAANGHIPVVLTLLQRGAHADRADKHGVTPEQLARENGFDGCADLLRDWAYNKDKDLREREELVGARPQSALSQYTTASKRSASAERRPFIVTSLAGEEPTRRRVKVKRSIDTALNMLKSGSTSASAATAAALAVQYADPMSALMRPSDEPWFPIDEDHSGRRPSLPLIFEAPGRRVSRRPRSAGTNTGADSSPGPHTPPPSAQLTPRRRLGSKYSLLSLLKKNGDEDGGSGGGLSPGLSIGLLPGPSPISPTSPSPTSPRRSGSSPLPVPAPRRPSFSSTAEVPSPSDSSPGSLGWHRSRLTSDTGVRPQPPTAVEAHHALDTNSRARSGSGASSDGITGTSAAPGVNARPGILRGHARSSSSGGGGGGAGGGGSGYSSGYGVPAPLSAQRLRFDSTSTTYSAPAAPSPHRNSMALRGSNSATSLRSIDERLPRVRVRSRSRQARGSEDAWDDSETETATLGKRAAGRGRILEEDADHEGALEMEDDEDDDEDEDEDDEYGTMLGAPPATVAELKANLQRLRGPSITSSASSLSPILSPDAMGYVEGGEFPFSFSHPPPGVNTSAGAGAGTEDDAQTRARRLLVPTAGPGRSHTEPSPSPTHGQGRSASQSRLRGGSVSSMSTNNSSGLTTPATAARLPLPVPGGGAGASVPSLASIPQQSESEPSTTPPEDADLDAEDAQALEGDGDGTPYASFAEHRASASPAKSARGRVTPLGIDLHEISSHAQAEALVARAQQSILDMVLDDAAGSAGASVGMSPLSARLAAYGESLAIERRLKEEEERRRAGREAARAAAAAARTPERRERELMVSPPVSARSLSGRSMEPPGSARSVKSSFRAEREGRHEAGKSYGVLALERQLSLDGKTVTLGPASTGKRMRRPHTSAGVMHIDLNSSSAVVRSTSDDSALAHGRLYRSRSTVLLGTSKASIGDGSIQIVETSATPVQTPREEESYLRTPVPRSTVVRDLPPRARTPDPEGVSAGAYVTDDDDAGFAPLSRTVTAPTQGQGQSAEAFGIIPRSGQRATANKLARMGFSKTIEPKQATGAMHGSLRGAGGVTVQPPGAARPIFGGIKSFVQSLKSKS